MTLQTVFLMVAAKSKDDKCLIRVDNEEFTSSRLSYLRKMRLMIHSSYVFSTRAFGEGHGYD